MTDSEAKAHIIVPLSRKVGIRATTHIAQSWRSEVESLERTAPSAAEAAAVLAGFKWDSEQANALKFTDP